MELKRFYIREVNEYQTHEYDELGDYVEWTPELQELADRDEVTKDKVKFVYSVTEAYGSSNRFECECGYDEILEGAVFCSSCGQRLNW